MGNPFARFGRLPIGLAPMAGVTDAPFRGAVRTFGDVLVYSEMVASAEVMRDRRSAALRLKADREAGPIAIQLAGRDPLALADVARIAEGEGALLIDINMGCPAKKVVGGQCGSALMREPDLAAKLVRAVVGAVSLPVTVKMRLGWDDSDRNAPELARRLEGEGAQAFTVHGRTRAQFYDGHSDWNFIGEVKRAVRVPVLANGDVRSIEDAIGILDVSRADGVLVGRGAFGRPWVIAQMQAAVRGESMPSDPRAGDKWRVALAQYRGSLAHYGEDLGRRVVRKHLGWYADCIAGDKALRDLLVRSSDPEPLLATLATDAVAVAA